LDVAWRLVHLALPAGADYQPGNQALHIALPLQQLAPALALDEGDLPTARAWLEAYDRWLAWTGAVLGRSEGQALWAAYHRQAGDPDKARAHAEAALAHAGNPRQPLALLAAHRLLGELHREAGCYDDADEHLQGAVMLAEACAAPFERAITLLAMARLARSQDHAGRARRHLSDAHDICVLLGARPTLERIAALEAELPTG
jgi:tetratricopeptide (TPR) repeat protein